MRTAFIFTSVFCAALLFGALVAYPVYEGLAFFGGMEFHRVISRTTSLSGLLFSLLYLRYYGLLSVQGLAWQGGHYRKRALFSIALIAGILIILVLATCLVSLGIYHFDVKVDTTVTTMIGVLIKALLTGVLVGLVEETIFRGALFGGLNRQTNWLVASVVTSFLYAAVHFIKYRAVPEDVDIGWLTGVEIFPAALFRFSNPVTIDSFLTLLILGFLFALIRIRSNSIIPCIGLHAGIVASIKVFNYLTNYSPANDYDFLVNKIDHQFGYLASGILLLVLLVYHLLSSPGAKRHADAA